MIAAARSVERAGPAIGPAGRDVIGSLALWLLAAVGFDLIVTRFVVRLAIFVPKGEPFATASSVLGRVGAAADALVPIVAGVLLVALLVRAGQAGRRIDQAMLTGVAVVGAGGLALVVFPPTPVVLVVLDLLVGALASIAGVRIGLARGLPLTARLGLGSLAIAVAVAAISRAADGGLLPNVMGQIAFIVGAALAGLAGVVAAARARVMPRRLAAAGIAAGVIVLAAGSVAPINWATLTTWSIGLTGGIPTLAGATAVGLAVAGLPMLHGRAPWASLGAGIVLLAGYGLAASGLVLASLLGLIVAGFDGGDRTVGSRGVTRRHWGSQVAVGPS